MDMIDKESGRNALMSLGHLDAIKMANNATEIIIFILHMISFCY